GFRQSEVKAHHFRFEIFDRGAERRIEWCTIARRHGRSAIDAEFDVIRHEPLTPSMLARIVELGWLVHEEIQIDRLRRSSAECFYLRPHLPLVEHSNRQ